MQLAKPGAGETGLTIAHEETGGASWCALRTYVFPLFQLELGLFQRHLSWQYVQ